MEEKRKENRGGGDTGFWYVILNNALTRKIFLGAVLVLVLVTAYRTLWKGVIFPNIFENKEGKVTTISTASLKEILGTGDLAVLKNFYNSYATVYDEDGETVKYYVAYEGTIRLGIDFEKIKTSTDEKKKQMTILLPRAEILDVNVKPDTMEYIFTSDSYETETVSAEAFKECNKDLKIKAGDAEELLSQAEENAKDVVSAFVQPLKESLGSEYKIKIEFQNGVDS